MKRRRWATWARWHACADLTAEAIELHGQALALSRAIGHKAGEAQNLANLALAYREKVELQAALMYQNEALALVETLDQPELVWRVRAGRAETYRRLGQPELAAADLRTAVTSIESVRERSEPR